MSSWWKSAQYNNVFDMLQLWSIWFQLRKTSLISETQFGFLARSLWVLRSVTQRAQIYFPFWQQCLCSSMNSMCNTYCRNDSPTSHSDSTNHTCSSRITPFPSFWTYFGPLLAEHRTPSQHSNYTGCLRRNSKYFRSWQYGLFRVNKSIQTCVQFSVGVEIQLFEVGRYRSDFCLWGWMKSEVYKEKVNARDELVARIVNSAALTKQERQDDLRRATRTFAKRVEKCIEVDGGIF